jgi:hypothetical protein
VIDRRDFLGASLLLVLPGLRRALPPLTVSISFADFQPGSAGLKGLTLGIEEAQHAASLFSARVILSPWRRTKANSAPGVAQDPVPAPDVSAIITAGDKSRCLALSLSFALPVLNTACTDDTLRRADRAQNLFHVAPSDSMLRETGPAATTWLPSLERFGADTLNRRFLKRFGQPMSAPAWAGWFAVKVIWETALRARSGDAQRIESVMPTMKFDGHKGEPLAFRSSDRQLLQPLYRAP